MLLREFVSKNNNFYLKLDISKINELALAKSIIKDYLGIDVGIVIINNSFTINFLDISLDISEQGWVNIFDIYTKYIKLWSFS